MRKKNPQRLQPMIHRRRVYRESWLTFQARLLIFSLIPLVVLTTGGFLLFVGIDAKGQWSIPAVFLIVLCIGAFTASFVLGRHVLATMRNLTEKATRAMADQYDTKDAIVTTDVLVRLERTIDILIDEFEKAMGHGDVLSRLNSGLDDMQRQLFGLEETGDVVQNGLEFISRFTDLNEAAFYFLDETDVMCCIGRFPDHVHPDAALRISHPGDAIEKTVEKKRLLFFRKDLTCGESSIDQADLITLPVLWKEKVQGVLKMERSEGFSPFHLRFAKGAAQIMGAAIEMASALGQKAILLERASRQKKNIDSLQTALTNSLEELEDQHQAFEATRKKLRLKQLETEAANAQMLKNALDLEAHMAILEKQNAALETARLELEEKARELEITSQYKTSFLANMSHELRTPLNSILLLSRLLQESEGKPLTDKRLEFAKTIRSAGEDLLNLIDEVLDLATIESGKMAVNLAPVTIRSIADTMAEIFSPLAEQKRVAFSTRVAPEVPERVITDRKRIGQIVKNFLSNAFKFTERGSVTLEIDVAAGDPLSADRTEVPRHDCLTIAVADTGIGIPSDKIQMVFEAFEQVDGSTRRKYGGTGLGLSISRQLAQLLGGDITLESQEGEGSRFALNLPIIQEEEKGEMIFRAQIRESSKFIGKSVLLSDDTTERVPTDAEKKPWPSDRRIDTFSLKGKTILLADDDMRTVFALSNALEAQGARVLAGKTGKESLDKIHGFPEIDLVIMDVMITGTDGYEALRTIRGRKEHGNLPIIALTAKAMKGDRSKCIAAGANDYLSKPVNLDALMTIIDNRLAPPSPDDQSIRQSPDPE